MAYKKPPQIEVFGLIKFKSEEKMLYAQCSEAKKKLYVTLHGSFEVWHKGEKIFEHMQPNPAVTKYNEIL